MPAIITVNTLADAGPGSLRAAVETANQDATRDTIVFAPSIAGTITLESALPDLTSDVTIAGPGASSLTIARDSSADTNFRIFNVTAGSMAASGLTITGGNGIVGGAIQNFGSLGLAGCVLIGNHAAYGGAIENKGTLTIDNSILAANVSDLDGGAIHDVGETLNLSNSIFYGNVAGALGGAIATGSNSGGPQALFVFASDCIFGANIAHNAGGAVSSMGGTTLTVYDAIFVDNSATGNGGAINNAGYLTVTYSTFTGNRSGFNGGGIYEFFSRTMRVIGSTFSLNTAGGDGGGIALKDIPAVQLDACTFAENSAGGVGASLSLQGGTLQAGNVLFADGPGEIVASGGSLTSAGYNLFTTLPATHVAPTDLIGAAPRLDVLRFNGGPVPTRALLPGSAAIDAGSIVPGYYSDARGVARSYGLASDIGAFESRGFLLSASSGGDQSATLGSAFAAPLVISVSSPFGEPVAGGVVSFSATPSEATAALSAPESVIGPDGRAAVSATAFGDAGTFGVIARANGGNDVGFALTNLPIPILFPPASAPTVLGLRRIGIRLQPTTILLAFSEPLDGYRAGNPSNYRVVSAGSDGRFGTRDDRTIPIRLASLLDADRSVILTTARRLPLRLTYRLIVNGQPPAGLASALGVPLGGQGADSPGTDYVATFDRRSFSS